MKNAHVEQDHREAYWRDTREQLKAAQKRADVLTLLGLAAIAGLLWAYHEPGDGFGPRALTGLGIALVVICAPLWFLTRRKRSISVARGLVCQQCGYTPHDTEISEVASTRRCKRCEQSLD